MNPLLPELSIALKAFGVEAEHRRGMIQIKIKGTDPSGYAVYTNWDGADEDGLLAFFLRDQVRRVAPGSYCKPIQKHDQKPGFLTRVVVCDEECRPVFGPDIPVCFAENDTSAYASALIALAKAGVVPGDVS